jgi:hypothetical protein
VSTPVGSKLGRKITARRIKICANKKTASAGLFRVELAEALRWPEQSAKPAPDALPEASAVILVGGTGIEPVTAAVRRQ